MRGCHGGGINYPVVAVILILKRQHIRLSYRRMTDTDARGDISEAVRKPALSARASDAPYSRMAIRLSQRPYSLLQLQGTG